MELQGKTILFLGSSVTYGSAANGVSFADIMEKRCGIKAVKEAVSGTTLADIDDSSYAARLKRVSKTLSPDLFICQLSTNDTKASKNISLAQVEDAIRFILEYVKDTFGCGIVFYTGTYFENEKYEEMIKLLYRLQAEYDFHILDLFHDAQMRAVSPADYQAYMRDPRHPLLRGYEEWWTPKFIEFCRQLPY